MKNPATLPTRAPVSSFNDLKKWPKQVKSYPVSCIEEMLLLFLL
jgi:hypothetical protein